MISAFFAFAITLTSSFEGGNIKVWKETAPGHVRVELPGETDQDGRNRQANSYAFRLDGVRGRALTIELVKLEGEYNYAPNKGAVTGDTPGWWSEDNEHWQAFADFEYDARVPSMKLRVTPKGDTLWVAHVPPYTNVHLEKLRAAIKGSAGFKEEVMGRTPGGRAMYHWTIGEGRAVWVMARQHSWEAPTSWVAEGLVRYLLSAEGRAATKGIEFHILPMNDPDGVARGGVRFNAKGYDLNRNWDLFNEREMPEIAAQHAAIARFLKSGGKIELFVSMHNTETAEYLQGPPGGRFEALGKRLFARLEATRGFAASRPVFAAEETTTAGKPGRMTVVQGLWRDFGIAAFLTEQRVSKHPKLGRQATVADRLAFGAELAQALVGAVRGE